MAEIYSARVDDELATLDPLLKAIAAKPHLEADTEEELAAARRVIEIDYFDSMDKRGIFLRQAASRIWRGERDVDAVCEGLDYRSAMMAGRILQYARTFDDNVATY